MSKNKHFLLKFGFWFGLVTSGLVYMFAPWNKPYKTLNTMLPYYDYIIVGGGTAGCVLASRLSEISEVNVLLVEAGGEFNFLSKIPVLPTLVQRGANDWSFNTTSQKYSSFGLVDNKQFAPRGKGLGGSGQLNYFIHGLASREDYQRWTEMGAEGWSYEVLEPYIKKAFGDQYERIESTNRENNTIKLSGTDDKLQKITNIFLDSIKQLKNSLQYFSAPFSFTIHNGNRESTFKRYLQPHLARSNLHVIPHALATKINFRNLRAYSMELLQTNRTRQIIALNEIILSCGAIQTPQLLMLSGIGPESVLKKHNIEIVSALEGVGENLHDHLNMPLYVSIEHPLSITLDKVLSFDSVFEYFWKGKGYISTPGVVAYAMGPKNAAAVLFAMGSTDERLLRYIANTKSETFREFFPFYSNSSREGVVFLSTCLQPSSRGTVNIKNTNPEVLPILNPNYLSKKEDIHCTISGLRLIHEIANTQQFKRIGARIHWPELKSCKSKWTDDINDDYLECIIRYGALTGHHLGGTSSMAGKSPVVNPSLKVHGVSRLRVMDASVFPTPISSYPNSMIIAMAERAADLIKDDRLLSKK